MHFLISEWQLPLLQVWLLRLDYLSSVSWGQPGVKGGKKKRKKKRIKDPSKASHCYQTCSTVRGQRTDSCVRAPGGGYSLRLIINNGREQPGREDKTKHRGRADTRKLHERRTRWTKSGEVRSVEHPAGHSWRPCCKITQIPHPRPEGVCSLRLAR